MVEHEGKTIPVKPDIPGSLWERPDTIAALRARDIGRLFHLLRQYAGLSQTIIGSHTNLSQGKVSDIMNGRQKVVVFEVIERIANGLSMPDPARMALGLAPRNVTALLIPRKDDAQGFAPQQAASSVEVVRASDEGESVRRRQFVGLTGAALFNAVIGRGPVGQDPQEGSSGVEDLAAVLAEPAPALLSEAPDIAALAGAVVAAKEAYQACHYTEVLALLPPLLRTLRIAPSVMDGDQRRGVHALSAEAHHVAASILLKQDDKGLAWLAADRSVQAAHASESPLMIASSARIITHALMDGTHHRAAYTNAATTAERMAATFTQPTPNDLSVYGSLLLRGAIAAAQHGNRATTAELLDEADQAGQRLGHEGNHMWTAFGPGNVLCHRVNIALSMGDAGTAIEAARRIDIDSLPINERKATLLLDTSRAFLIWGKHEQALHVLRAAGQIAPEEITGRPATLRLVRDLIETAPISTRRETREYAETLGVTP
ncbi:helix-turn-helix domain-containing protein [Acrocarpospora macrocephala]|uniref:helix-turn-helix domain-containing protein n=1 Tax=Acrocarpospora macrocephala TaxID=150177 RepID=UPI0014788D32|nr:helix-turn-helix transcriptional regulator [Acrocarpospora macrocephala]